MKELKGAGVALVTPFDAEGKIDFDGLGQLIDHQIKGKMDYLVSLGTTGESATLSAVEKYEVWKYSAERVAGRVPLVAGIGGNHTAEIIEQVSKFKIKGYQAILSVSPYYNRPTQEGIIQHYTAIADASQLPVILYNVPGRTGSHMEARTSLKLAKTHPNIIAIKEASGDFATISSILKDKPSDFLVISGDDALTLPMMALGAVGAISVIGNAFPEEVKSMVQLCEDGNYEKAREIHHRLMPYVELCFVDGNPAGVKKFLQFMKISQGGVRLPLVAVSDMTEQQIKQAVRAL